MSYRNAYQQKDWQEAQFDLLLRFDAFCQEHDLSYSLDFGSMIGAIRHRGYIPWDNDIDVTMIQDEYDKLIELARQGILPEGCKVLDRTLSSGYQQAFGRLIDTRTSCFLSRTAWIEPDNGLFVDIFTLRPLPREERAKERAIRDFLVYDEAISQVKRRAGHRTLAFKKRYFEFMVRSKIFGYEKAVNWIKDKADSYLGEKNPEWYLLSSGGWYNGFEHRRSEWVHDIVRLPVNGHQLPVFAGYLDILRVDYGDGWRNWPEGDPAFASYHANLNLPGEFVARDSYQAFDRAKAVSALKRAKKLEIYDMFIRDRYSPYAYAAKGLLTLARVETDLTGFDLAAFAQRHTERGDAYRTDAKRVHDAFASFIAMQTGQRYSYWSVAIPINPSWLAAALWSALVTCEDYWTVQKLLKIYRSDTKGAALIDANPTLQTVERFVELVSDLHLAMDQANVTNVEALLKEIDALCPEAHDRRIGSIWLAAQKNPVAVLEDHRFEEDLHLCSECGEYLAYRADALESLGHTEDARALRLEALEKTRNGMIILAINDAISHAANDNVTSNTPCVDVCSESYDHEEDGR